MEEKKKEEEKSIIGLIAFSFCVVLALWILTLSIIPNIDYFKNWTERGTFGDMFGSINALFSGLAFAGVIIAILLQKQELTLQRKELEQTREELKGQKEQLALQNETFKLQQFENTFFNMLKLHNDIVENLSWGERNDAVNGRRCFRKYYSSLRAKIQGAGNLTDVDERYKVAYSSFYNEFKAKIAHYFRNLYYLLKFVNKYCPKDKIFYADIVRAQLSSYEIDLLFYHCLSEFANKNFKYLITEFMFLRNISDNIEDSLKANYDQRAFGE